MNRSPLAPNSGGTGKKRVFPFLIRLPRIGIGGLFCLLALGAAATSAQTPAVFWASDPVLPNDTVLVMGEDLGAVTSVQVRRLPDAPAGAGTERWLPITPLQVTGQSVKFTLPAAWKLGVYACRLLAGPSRSAPFLVNAPDPWWHQGDGGEASSPGGWLRVFGKCLSFGGGAQARLKAADGTITILKADHSDGYALNFPLPRTLKLGKYAMSVQNSLGGVAGWKDAGSVEVRPAEMWPTQVFNVMDFYGAKAEEESQKTLDKGSAVPDRTEAIQAALQKASAAGGGVVYFPPGKYAMQGTMTVPPHTLLRGAGAGLTLLWWGRGGFALDGGSEERHLQSADAAIPSPLIQGGTFGLEDLSLYLPREYGQAISAGDGFRMQRVRIRIDRYWIRGGEREDGLTLRMGDNGQVTDCDILARGVAFAFGGGHNELIARNIVQAGKSHCSLEHSDGVIVEDNDFVSLDPTTYNNLSNEGRNIYYARNRHESLFAQQSDYSWTFDGTGSAYLGPAAQVDGTTVTLAHDPTYPAWAGESHPLWKRAVVSILQGRGAGQYRFVMANQGRVWQVDRPFQVAPDSSSTLAIIPFRGRTLVIGNRFEDAGWVNMGYGSSFDVVCAQNQLRRVGAFLNLGLRDKEGVQPSWFIQYLDNDVREGQTLVQTTADMRNPDIFAGTVTRAAIHRRLHLGADNSGRIDIGGNATDVIVEHCTLANPRSTVKAGTDTHSVLLRDNAGH